MHALRTMLLVFMACPATTAQGSPDAVTNSTNELPTDATTVNEDLSITDSAKIANFYLRNHTLRTLHQVPSLVVCGQKCASLGECRSLNYREAGGVCELNGANRAEFPDDLVGERSGVEVIYLGRASPILNINQPATCLCCNNACQHGAYCVPSDDATDGEATLAYKCVCSSGWTGDNCEIMIAKWSTWSNWSACWTQCGPGRRSRTRECIGSAHAPDSCQGDEVEYRNCWNQELCAEWSTWADVGPCSASNSCGQGTVDRTRVCRENRSDCSGADSETDRCRSVSCEAPWRLVGGSRPGEGRLEVYSTVRGLWGTVCFDDWDRWDTNVACRTLGFLPPPTYMDPGYESLCDSGWVFYEGFCYWGAAAQHDVGFVPAEAICQVYAAHLVSILTAQENVFVRTTFADLPQIWLGAHNGALEDDGQIHTSMLWSDGSFPAFREVVLQDAVPDADRLRCVAMRSKGNWEIAVCTKKKHVVCKKYPHFSLQFGPGKGAIHLASMECQGCEDHLNQCSHGNWHDVTSCSHSQDVGLKCSVACPTYHTNTATDARFPFEPLDFNSLLVNFTVKTTGTIELILSGSEDSAQVVYTIRLSTTEASSIYYHSSELFLDETMLPDIFNPNAYQGFWLTKTDSTIRVGKAEEGAPFLESGKQQLEESSVQEIYAGFDSFQPAEWQFGSFCK